jgi:octaprenyl-diphosphate synthase
MQLSNRHNLKTSTEDYYKIIRAKTSLLFSASGQIAAIISQLPLTAQENMARFGEHLGNAFQLIDDALDYCADPEITGKTIGNDLADGKVTMPLICALEKANAKQYATLSQAFKTGNLQDILKIIQETHAIENTKEIAQAEITKAIAAIECLPDSVYKEALVDLAHYMVERDH